MKKNKWLSVVIMVVLAVVLLRSGMLEQGGQPGGVSGAAQSEDQPAESIPVESMPAESDTVESESGSEKESGAGSISSAEKELLARDASYTSKNDVALYLHQYGELPENFITKKEAEKLGWEGGSLEPYAPGRCIGGSRFGNYEGLLPEKEGRFYTECDVDTLGAKSRGAKRIVFSNDGLIFYTEDHYESFELLYGEADE